MVHLWEVDHAYCCNLGNYFATSRDLPITRFKSFADFLSEWGDADFDYNLLFRWDWHEGEDHDLPPYNGDDNYRNGLLLIFWMGQRKGLYQWSEIEVCRADEPEVIKFLQPRFEHLMKLWEPLTAFNSQENKVVDKS
jgi:hypothetical protein